MFLWLWTFLRGYVAVEVTGTAVERFLNLAAHREIYIWDVSRVNYDESHDSSGRPGAAIQMHCSIKGFRLLRECAKKTKCRLRIVRREGFPFVMHRYRRRKILMGGVAFFILSLYVLSSFVWYIDISGNERVSSDTILEHSRTLGLHVGAFKHFVDHKEVSRAILAEFPDIVWADVYTRGTRTNIIISETIGAEPDDADSGGQNRTQIPRDIPCNIVAARDGLITSIVTASGIPMVRQHDVVREGDLLVTGALPVQQEHTGHTTTIFVHAYAEVWARMYTPIQFAIPMSYVYKVHTGEEHRQYSLQLLIGSRRRNRSDDQNNNQSGNQNGNRIDLLHTRIPFDNYDKIVSHIQPGASGNYPLPFIWTITSYREFVPETRQRTVEAAKALADRVITERIIREFDFQADIIDKQIEFAELPDQLVVRALITTNERIDMAVRIENPISNEPNVEATGEVE